MTATQLLLANTLFLILIFIVYRHSTFAAIKNCYGMWFKREYWTDYNTVEFLSWAAKAIIIIPGLIFGISIWWLYFLTLFTSLTLIWASNKKLLPTLVGFNTIWVWISCMVLAKNLIN
ncbi:MAG: hypothetical protein EB127_00580 [Alphaproteobacteria bacterium]|nr:hypothetical protein [Alphaproteobacteria bacterium]